MQFSRGQTPDQGRDDFIIYRMPQKFAQTPWGIQKTLRRGTMSRGLQSTWGDLTNGTSERIATIKLGDADTSCAENRDISGLGSRRKDVSEPYGCTVFELREGTHGGGG